MSQQKKKKKDFGVSKKAGTIWGRRSPEKGSVKSEGKCIYKWSLFPGLSRVENCFPGLEEETVPEWG